jgi:hypothetical protein
MLASKASTVLGEVQKPRTKFGCAILVIAAVSLWAVVITAIMLVSQFD